MTARRPRAINRPTWNHGFYCFSGPATHTPSSIVTRDLENASLGNKVMRLPYSSSFEDICQEIVTTFPQLQGHNFQLRKAASGGPHKNLVPIVDDQSTLSVATFISQRCGIIYIVPDSAIMPGNIMGVLMEPEVEEAVPFVGNAANHTSDYMEVATMQELRARLHARNPDRSEITIDRHNLLRSTLNIYDNLQLNLLAKPQITFMSEQGVDEGALTNEFFTQALEALVIEKYNDIALFEGSDDYKLPTVDLSLLRLGTFNKVGKLMAHSAINTNVAFVGMHPVVSTVIFGGSISPQWPFTELDVPDCSIRDLVVKARSPPESWDNNLFGSLNNIASDCGYFKTVTSANLQEAVQTILYYQIYYKRKDFIEHMKEGFNAVIPSLFSAQRDFLREGLFPKRVDLDISLVSLLGKIVYRTNGHEFIKEAVELVLTSKIDELNNVLIAWTGAPYLPLDFLYIQSSETNFIAHVCDKTIDIPHNWTTERIIEYLNILFTKGRFGFGSP